MDTESTSSYLWMVFAWYGLMSFIMLISFASLAYEVEHGQHACEQAGDSDAWKVVCKTLNINFVVYLVASVTVVAACAMAASIVLDGETPTEWRGLAGLSILATGAYVSYTRSCERGIISFLTTLQIYPAFRSSDRWPA